jgi:hypothetical protein
LPVGLRASRSFHATSHPRQSCNTSLFADCLPQDRGATQEPSDWFYDLTQRSDTPVTILVNADPIVHVPWGLVHEFGTDHQEVDPYMGFWALRYQIAALYNGMTPRQLRTARSAEKVKLLSALNQAVFESAQRKLDPDVRDFILSFLDRPVGRAFTKKGCSERWAQVGDNDCIIQFFGHANGSELRFSDTDLLNASGFRDIFRRESSVVRPRTEPAYILTFLNGCASGSGEDADSFLVATADPGFCGFIGAEAEIPDIFAMMFGYELLHLLMNEGASVREAMSRLLKKHRPMALLYGCYAHPDFTISPKTPGPSMPREFDRCNFYPAEAKV